LAPYGSVQRQGVPETLGRNGVVHEGAIGWLDGKRRIVKYAKWQKDGGGPEHHSAGAWLGVTDHYWLTALIPAAQEQITGRFGLATLALTVLVRLLMFPLANKQYESMTKMKKVQPAMEELRRKFKDDPARQQQELMALYQKEKVNPLAGCLPILVTIPVF